MSFQSRHGPATDRAVVTNHAVRASWSSTLPPVSNDPKENFEFSETEFRRVNRVKLEVYADCPLAKGSLLSLVQSRIDGSDCTVSCGAIVLSSGDRFRS